MTRIKLSGRLWKRRWGTFLKENARTPRSTDLAIKPPVQVSQILPEPLNRLDHADFVVLGAAEIIGFVVLRARQLDDLLGLPAGLIAFYLLIHGHEEIVFRVDEHDGARRDPVGHPLGLVAPAGFRALKAGSPLFSTEIQR